jgi:two-component system, NtrC family, nitrogen regulation response regulator NtrX
MLDSFSPHLLLADLELPGLAPGQLVERLAWRCEQGLSVVVMSGLESTGEAVAALRSGAADYLVRPLHVDELIITAAQALQLADLRREVCQLRDRLRGADRLRPIVGSTPAMQAVRAGIEQAMRTRAPLLLTGEPGTGRRLAARTVHRAGPRDGPLVVVTPPVNGALPLAEADRGTLYIADVQLLDDDQQAELLRYLTGPEPDRVRVVSSASLSLVALEARVQPELLALLGAIRIGLPPLRQRKADLPLLADEILRRSVPPGAATPRIRHDAMKLILEHDWPGNVAELVEVIARATCSALPAGRLDADSLGRSLARPGS